MTDPYTLLPPLDDENTPDRNDYGTIPYSDREWELIMKEWRGRQISRARENKRRGGLGMCSGVMWYEEP